MVINELKKVIIDTLEFLIPPFIKLAIAIIILHYISYGIPFESIPFSIADRLDAIKLKNIKSIIDSLYLSSIVPIIAILVLISLAYAIDRITGFIGTLIPISYTTVSTVHNEYYLREIWKYFPESKNVNELSLKINQLFTTAKSSSPSVQFDQVAWAEEKRQKLFRNINFINFLLIWSIVSFIFVRANIDSTLLSGRLFLIIFLLVLVMTAVYFMIVRNELDIELARLMVVDNFLKVNTDYSNNVSQEQKNEIDKLLKLEKYYNKRWWSISIGYRFDWLLMYKHFRPPFYWRYQVWKDKRRFRNDKKTSD